MKMLSEKELAELLEEDLDVEDSQGSKLKLYALPDSPEDRERKILEAETEKITGILDTYQKNVEALLQRLRDVIAEFRADHTKGSQKVQMDLIGVSNEVMAYLKTSRSGVDQALKQITSLLNNLQELLHVPEKPPSKWDFEVIRNENGYIKEIKAIKQN
jgi:hypothetical protein